MNVSTSSTQTGTPQLPLQSSWSAGIASLAFSGVTVFLFQLYTHVHWTVLFQHRRELQSTPELDHALFTALSRLECYRVFAVFAVVWAVWALRGRPSLDWLDRIGDIDFPGISRTGCSIECLNGEVPGMFNAEQAAAADAANYAARLSARVRPDEE